jgi:cytochrome P450
MPHASPVSSVEHVTLLERDPPETLPDTRSLTAQRIERMSLGGVSRQPPVDTTGLPPGPAWPAWMQTVALFRFRHWFHPWLRKTYGPTFTVRMLPGGRPFVLFTRPEDIKELFAGDPEVFHAGKGNSILGPVMGEHSLLLQDGSEHKRARKLLMPAFNGQALRGYHSLVTDLARDEVAHWPADRTFASLDRMNTLTLEVILRVVFGVTDDDRLAALRPCVNRTVDVNPAVMLVGTYPLLQRLRAFRDVVANQEALDRLMYAEIRERRTAPDLAERTDVLSRLIREGADSADPHDEHSDRLGDTELRDQLVTLLLAGHETTATALSWALYELGRDPELMRRTQAAADASARGDAEGDAWLDAVMKESMRLHPVIPIVLRTLQEPVTIAGIDIPAGATVGPSIVVAHGKANYERADVFDPTRFLGHNPPTNTWIPFGGGVRRCIGAGFALMEGAAVLREVFQAWSVVTEHDDRPRVRNITSVPDQGARIKVLPR